MRKFLATIVVAASATLGLAGSAFASQPPGLRGYEGQPGHQAGGNQHHHAPGLSGYEGQPGNQGG